MAICNKCRRFLSTGSRYWTICFVVSGFLSKSIDLQKDLSFFKSKHLHDQSVDHINLLIIWMGCMNRCKIYYGGITEDECTSAIELTKTTSVLRLPTVTDFAKGACRGVQPTFMKEFELLFRCF